MDKLINFFKGREQKHETQLAAEFSTPKLARIGALQGKLLIATPKIQDSFFAKSLIFVATHNDNGAMGVVVNHPLEEVSAKEVVQGLGVEYPKFQFRKPKIEVYRGGPVDELRGFVLHSADYKTANTVAFPNGVAITSEKAVLSDAIRNRGPKHLILAMGYAAWVKGQLESEIELGAWVVVPASEEIVFDLDNSKKWAAAEQVSGMNLSRIIHDVSLRVN